jgi:hypothetical protein
MSMYADDGLKELCEELQQISADGTEVWARQDRARQVRFNEWAGQSPDGRRHGDAMDGDALPFEGAPDNRIPLVDTAINEKVRLCKRAFFRAMVQAKPIESGDSPRSANVDSLLGWLRDRAMREELLTEVELSAQYLFGDDPGVVVVEVSWLRDLGLERKVLTLDDVAVMFATGEQDPSVVQPDDPRLEPELMAEFMDLVTNPERKTEWLQWLGAMFPGASRKALMAAAKELKTENATELPVPMIRENRPQVQALKLFDEIFFPIGTVDIQRARSIHRREWLSEVELQERVMTLGWDQDVVDEIVKKGRGQSLLTQPIQWRTGTEWSVTLTGPGRAVNERDNLFEIWWSYRREADDLGVPGITCTTWSSVVKHSPLKRSVADYPHGKYPFVLRTRERLGRQTTDSRGMSVPLATHQNEIKVQRDSRGAYVQLLASPPLKTRIQRGAYELVLGPNAQIPVQKMDDFDIVKLPAFMNESVEMERVTRDEANHYAGMMTVDADQNRVAMITQDETDNFLGLWSAVFGQALSLTQSYMSAAELARITGQQEMEMKLTPADIRGGFDVSIQIDARDLNMESVTAKTKAFGELLGMDSQGVLDRSPYIKWAAYSLDPILARLTITPEGSVTKKMIDEERANVSQMVLGLEPIMSPNGVTNPKFRMETVVQTVQQSPRLSQAYQSDEVFRTLVENYSKYLEQQINQEENKVVGRLGTSPTQGVQGLYAGAAAGPTE